MIPYGKHYLDKSDIDAVVRVLQSPSLTQGPYIDEFEKQIAKYVGAKYAVAVSSGTAALHLSVRALKTDETSTLITTPITFVATANAGIYTGCKVAFTDIDPLTINMCPLLLESKLQSISGRKIVIPVHYAGLPCDMKSIRNACEAHDSVLIEDAAHALGARYEDGSMVGSCQYSLMTIFSFHPVKAIAAGEGGMVTTNDENIYKKLLRLRSHGINKGSDSLLIKEEAYTNGVLNPWYYEMQELGYHYRITDIQASLASSQFKKLSSFLTRRREICSKYAETFSSTPLVSPAQPIQVSTSANHIYPIRINFERLNTNRADLMNSLRALGVGTQVHYIPVPLQPFYRSLNYDCQDLPNSIAYYRECLSIPCYYGLKDDEQRFVIDSLISLLG